MTITDWLRPRRPDPDPAAALPPRRLADVDPSGPNALGELMTLGQALADEIGRIRAYNHSCRTGHQDLSLLDLLQREALRQAALDDQVRPDGSFPVYHTAGLAARLREVTFAVDSVLRRMTAVDSHPAGTGDPDA